MPKSPKTLRLGNAEASLSWQQVHLVLESLHIRRKKFRYRGISSVTYEYVLSDSTIPLYDKEKSQYLVEVTNRNPCPL